MVYTGTELEEIFSFLLLLLYFGIAYIVWAHRGGNT
jgi:hypothetical protein